MSNVALFNASQAPAFARKGLSETAKALAGGTANSGKRISIKGGVFRLLAGGKEVASIDERFLDVVIVKAAPKVSRVFYAKAYDAEAVSGPDCWSADGETPSPDSSKRQASRCSECPQNIAGSGQGNSRACRYQQRLAVVLANHVDGDVLQLVLPATSIFGKADDDNRPLQEYARWLAAQDISPETVVTRMKFDTKSESPKLFFKTMRWLSDDEYETVELKGESPEAQKAVSMTGAKMDGVGTPLKLEGKPPVKAKVAAPVVEEVEEEEAPPPKAKKAAKPTPAPVVEEVDEPEVRTAPKKPAVDAKGSLAQMVDAWDDE
jgi:hypothetical protein